MIDFYAVHKLLVWSAAIVLPVAGCLLHYFCFGPHTVSVNQTAPVTLVRRFGILEWISHWFILISFMVLAVTGIMQLVQSIQHPVGPFHGWLGFGFFLVSVVTLLVWIPDALFRSVDWQWMRVMGGYLSRNPQPLPSGRFNAGQKIYYWLIMVVLIGLLVSAIIMEQGSHTLEGRKELFWCIHGLLGCLATSMVIGHGYLSLFANPDTARVLWNGRVSKAYIDKYHALWEGGHEP
ncbi:MAG: cytochrome b/b6 domain-containing protein [Candidatus Saccharibacteria bacterium]